MRRCLIGLMLGTTLIWPGPPAMAAESVLTFADAIRLTRERALAILTNQQRLSSLRLQRDVLGAGLGPTVGLNVGANYRGLFNGLSQTNLDPTSNSVLMATGPGVDTTVSVSQMIWDGGATLNNVANASDQVAIGQLGVQQAELLTTEATAVAYLEVLRAESLQAVASDVVGQAKTQLHFGESRLKAGAATKADVLQLQARLAQTEDAWLQAQNAVALARLTLANAMNQPLTGQPALKPVVLTSRSTLTVADVDQAMTRRPDVLSQTLRLSVANRQIDIDQAGLYPTFNATARAQQRNFVQAGVQGGVAMDWPIYDGARFRNRAEADRHALEAEQLQLDLVKQAAELEIRQAELNRQQAISRKTTVRRAVTAAQEAYRIVVRRFALGLATVVELGDAQTILTQARQDEVRAAYDLIVAEVRLRRALGEDLSRPGQS